MSAPVGTYIPEMPMFRVADEVRPPSQAVGNILVGGLACFLEVYNGNQLMYEYRGSEMPHNHTASMLHGADLRGPCVLLVGSCKVANWQSWPH